MRQYFVIAKETCSVCGGEGVTCPHRKLYEDFADFCRSIQNESMHDQVNLRDVWMAERGYPYGSEHWPPEEIECHQCRGNGFIESRVPLEEAIKELMSKSDNQLIGS
jgi:hypothetical protein